MDLRSLRKALATYQRASSVRSILEILLTLGPLAVLWALAWWAALAGFWWIALVLTLPAAAFVVRLFGIQHDCGHKSFFANGAINDWVGRAIGVVTLTPYDCWRREHAMHHATSGNLDRQGHGGIVTLTTGDYEALKPLRRLGYRLYRHPLVLFVVGPLWVFFIRQRLPVGLMREGWRPWLSALGTNVAIALAVLLAVFLGGWKAFLLIHIPTMLVAGSIGVWMFFIQHQFEDMSWSRQNEWRHSEAALKGSSYYDLPAPLRWLTANLGIHHVHHIASRIPFYRLPAVLKNTPELRTIGRITLLQSVRLTRLSLWDEPRRKLVSFRQWRAATASGAWDSSAE